MTKQLITTLLILCAPAIASERPSCLMPPHESLADKPEPMQFYKSQVQDALFQEGLNDGDTTAINMARLSEWSDLTLKSFDLSPSAVPFNFRILAVCVQFPVTDATYPTPKVSQTDAAEFDTLIFGDDGFIDYSVRTFYRSNSHGRIDMVTLNLPSSLGWLSLDKPYGYYVNNAYGMGAYPQNTQRLFEELIALLDPLVDFSQYDNDGNGYSDGVVIVHPGRGAEFSGSTSDIWSHKWGIAPKRYDNVWVGSYSVQPEFWNAPGDMTIGVYAHEIGHLFGLPDLYDTDNSSRGAGKWSLMASGSWNGTLGRYPAYLDAWCRKQLGWATVKTVWGNMDVAGLSPSYLTDTVYQLFATNATSKAYCLIENRGERQLPGGASGLAIWKIDDATTTANKYEWRAGINGPNDRHYRVSLEEADGDYAMAANRNSGVAADLWNTGIYDVPMSTWYTGEATGWRVYAITRKSNMVVDFSACICGRMGDLNADAKITLADAAMAAQQTFEGDSYPIVRDSGCTWARVDVDCNWTPNIMDVSKIRRSAQGFGKPCGGCK